jgi:hypothetical protein
MFLALLFSTTLFAQTTLELTQSSPQESWEMIQNEFVEIIYPESMRSEAPYIAGLVEHYAKQVGQSFGIEKPKRFPLILRAEMADPNGFVTLGPRRSEWFASSNFSSFVGSSEWFQTLAIHEYRHVIQFDHFKQDLTKVLWYFFGDSGHAVAMFSGLQPWNFEGDAVWAETVYTDAGRGRSPAFMARLKTLLLNNELPTYDQWVNGTYNNRIPNHYVFGYVLVARAYKKFGPDFWRQVHTDVAKFPHPRRLYHVFKRHTGQELEEFYEETLQELKKEWLADQEPIIQSDFREAIYPFSTAEGVYSLNYNLDNYWRLTLKDQTIVEIPFAKGVTQFHLLDDLAVYTQFLPHSRYGFKSSSDLVVIDLKKRSQTRLTHGLRLYSPRLNSEGHIFAAEFKPNQQWVIAEFASSGKKLRELLIPGHKVAEVFPTADDEVIALLNSATGLRSIERINLATSAREVLLPASRNNIGNLYAKDGAVFFEAQYKGKVDIFRLSQGSLTQCTRASTMASNPSVYSDTLYYSAADGAGSVIKSTPLAQCSNLQSDALIAFNYLGNTPSDNYTAAPVVPFPEQQTLATAQPQSVPAPYGDFTKELLIPHTWSFLGGRGFAASARTDNYLRTLSMSALIGSSAEENANYSEFNFDIKKYYPIISLNAGLRRRAIDLFDSSDTIFWKEKSAGASTTLPFIARKNLFSSIGFLSAGANYLEANDYYVNTSKSNVADRHFHNTWVQGTYSLDKDLAARSIISPWSAGVSLRYDNADSLQGDYSAYRFFQAAHVTTPGLWAHHGLKLAVQREEQSVDASSYRFAALNATPNGYVFSRGYDYESVEEYRKASANYILPLVTPDWNLWGWYYLKRMTLNGFFDTTYATLSDEHATYNSYGSELEFESKILRILPINLGVRYIYKEEDSAQLGEVYFSIAGQL